MLATSLAVYFLGELMYKDAYNKANQVADQIRLGTFQSMKSDPSLVQARITPQDSGLARGGEESSRNKDTHTLMMAKYLESIRNPQSAPGGENISMPQFSGTTLDGDIGKAMRALGTIESSNNYQAIGPRTRTGARAYGKYQIMDFNIPNWTKEALGYSLTVEQFLASPEAQEAVTQFKFQQAFDQHGTWEDAASVWFSGRPMAKAGNASDGWNTVPEYVAKFRSNFR